MANIIKVNPDFYQEIKKALKFTDKQGSENFQNSIGFDIFKKRIIGATKAHLYCSEVNIEWNFVTPPQANPIQIKKDAAEYMLGNQKNEIILTKDGIIIGDTILQIAKYVNYEYVIPRELANAIELDIKEFAEIKNIKTSGVALGNLWEDDADVQRDEIIITEIDTKKDERVGKRKMKVERTKYLNPDDLTEFVLIMPLAPPYSSYNIWSAKKEIYLNPRYLGKSIKALKNRNSKKLIIGYNNLKSAILVTTE